MQLHISRYFCWLTLKMTLVLKKTIKPAFKLLQFSRKYFSQWLKISHPQARESYDCISYCFGAILDSHFCFQPPPCTLRSVQDDNKVRPSTTTVIRCRFVEQQKCPKTIWKWKIIGAQTRKAAALMQSVASNQKSLSLIRVVILREKAYLRTEPEIDMLQSIWHEPGILGSVGHRVFVSKQNPYRRRNVRIMLVNVGCDMMKVMTLQEVIGQGSLRGHVTRSPPSGRWD